jgi:acetyl/propionyl-CoA carboxylase alpha subunit
VLDEYRVIGVKTTVPFFQWLVQQPEFVDGRFSTQYLDRVLAERRGTPFVAPTDDEREDAAIAAAVSAWLRANRGRGRVAATWQRVAAPARLDAPPPRTGAGR